MIGSRTQKEAAGVLRGLAHTAQRERLELRAVACCASDNFLVANVCRLHATAKLEALPSETALRRVKTLGSRGEQARDAARHALPSSAKTSRSSSSHSPRTRSARCPPRSATGVPRRIAPGSTRSTSTLLKLPPTLGGMAVARRSTSRRTRRCSAEGERRRVDGRQGLQRVRLPARPPRDVCVCVCPSPSGGGAQRRADMPELRRRAARAAAARAGRHRRQRAIPAGFFSKMTSGGRLTISSGRQARRRPPASACPQSLLLDGNESTQMERRGRDDPDADGALRPEPDQAELAPTPSCRTPRSASSTVAKNPIAGCESPAST